MILWTRRAADPSVRVAVPALVGGIAIPVALYLSDPWLAMIAVTICACGVLSALPGFWSLPTAYLTGAAAAAGIGLVNSLGNLSGFVAPYVTGALADATGNNRIGSGSSGSACSPRRRSPGRCGGPAPKPDRRRRWCRARPVPQTVLPRHLGRVR
jgi:hypothetical protein